MQVGELSAETGVSVRAIRYYEQAGLIQATRGSNGYRKFDGSAAERVRAIRDLLDTGFTIDDVQSLSSCLPDPTKRMNCCSQTVSLYREKLARINEQMETLAIMQARIRERIAVLEPC
jgi:DNA-binding transcriptional MerR regulator